MAIASALAFATVAGFGYTPELSLPRRFSAPQTSTAAKELE